MMRDYRQSQFRRDWWSKKVEWFGGLTRNDLMFIAVGFALCLAFVKFPINWDVAFGLCPH